MPNLVKSYRGWSERRLVSGMERWGRMRIKGRERFERWTMLVCGGLMINFMALADYLMGIKFSLIKYTLSVPVYLFAGWLIGSSTWSSTEDQYQKYLAEGKRQEISRQ